MNHQQKCQEFYENLNHILRDKNQQIQDLNLKRSPFIFTEISPTILEITFFSDVSFKSYYTLQTLQKDINTVVQEVLRRESSKLDFINKIIVNLVYVKIQVDHYTIEEFEIIKGFPTLNFKPKNRDYSKGPYTNFVLLVGESKKNDIK